LGGTWRVCKESKKMLQDHDYKDPHDHSIFGKDSKIMENISDFHFFINSFTYQIIMPT
jgi:hypothetical protein